MVHPRQGSRGPGDSVSSKGRLEKGAHSLTYVCTPRDLDLDLDPRASNLLVE